MRLLQIDSSPMGDFSVSRRLTKEFVECWQRANPGGEVVSRDLAAMTIPVIDLEWIAANFTPAESRTQRQNEILALARELTGELLWADEYVFGVPVHNWGPAASFKLRVDQIVAPFGPELRGKRATLVIAAGRYFRRDTRNPAREQVATWLRALLEQLGVKDLRFVLADGAVEVRNGEQNLETFLAPHVEAIRELFAHELSESVWQA